MTAPRPQVREAPRVTAREISERLALQVDSLVPQLLPQAKKVAGYWRVGSLAGEPGQSLAIYTQWGRAGKWRDYANAGDDGRGDLLDLIRLTQNMRDLGEAIRWAKGWLGIADDAPLPPIRREQVQEQARSDLATRHQHWARELWARSLDPNGTPAALYLHNRGIRLALPAAIRYVPELTHKPTETRWPAVLASVQAVDGEVTGVWRIWLGRGEDGTGPWAKAPVSPAKMGLGACDGGWVLIHHVLDCPTVVITEGVEDALAVRERWRKGSIIAALSASLMRKVVLPPHWTDVIVFGDRDDVRRRAGTIYYPGQDAANALGIRLMEEGRQARVALIPEHWAAKDAAAALVSTGSKGEPMSNRPAGSLLQPNSIG